MCECEDKRIRRLTFQNYLAAMSTTYTLKIKTGEKKYAGTDANVFAVLFGEKDDTGELYINRFISISQAELQVCVSFVMLVTGIVNLKACKNYKNKFEQGMINEFTLEAVDLGDPEKLRIGHDNSG